MKQKLLLFFFSLLFLKLSIAQVTIKNLRCEMLTNPWGIDAAQPRFSWQLESNERSVTQISYQIIISSS